MYIDEHTFECTFDAPDLTIPDNFKTFPITLYNI